LGAVYDPRTDSFQSIAKIGSGLSEENWGKIRRLLDDSRVRIKPARVDSRLTPGVWVEPRYVVTVLADEITRSPVHTCATDDSGRGLALRFPTRDWFYSKRQVAGRRNDPNRGFRYCVRIGFRFRQHRCDMANEAVSLVFEVGCKRQRIVLGLNNENASETGIPDAGMRKCIPKQSFAFSQRLRLDACNDQLCLWCYWISDHGVGSAIPYPACNVRSDVDVGRPLRHSSRAANMTFHHAERFRHRACV